MKYALVFLALTIHAQTRISSDVEIRQMEAAARRGDFNSKIAAHVNLAELRLERNEPAAAQREYEAALDLAQKERDAARSDHSMPRYAAACGWAGVALAGLGRGAEAFAVLEEGVRYSAESPNLWNSYSVAMFRLGHLDKAVGAARISVAAGERQAALRPNVRQLLELNVERFALAEALLDSTQATDEAEAILRRINESLDSDAFARLRTSVGRNEDFQIVAAAATDNGMYLSIFNRSHIRLAGVYEKRGAVDKARAEYQAVVSKRSDEPMALAGLARLATDPKERERYFNASLDANPFAPDVIDDYSKFLETGNATPATGGNSDGARVRLALQQLQSRDYRQARATLQSLLQKHPNNDVPQSLLERTEVTTRPWFLTSPVREVTGPTEWDLRAVLGLLSANKISPADLATLDKMEFTSEAKFDGDAFEHGTMQHVPFKFQSAVQFKGVAVTSKQLRITYRILGATTVGDRDALLVEPIRAEAQ